jgi:hypothetical protein
MYGRHIRTRPGGKLKKRPLKPCQGALNIGGVENDKSTQTPARLEPMGETQSYFGACPSPSILQRNLEPLPMSAVAHHHHHHVDRA